MKCVEIYEENPNENRGCLFSICYKEVSYIHLRLSETQSQAGEWENVRVKERESFRYALITGCWHGSGGGLTRIGSSHVIDLGTIFI